MNSNCDTECDVSLYEIGELYLNECVQIAKDYPSIDPGMLVMVFLHGAWDTRGRVLNIYWDEGYLEHYAEVELVGGEIEYLWCADLKPVSYRGSTLYAILKQKTISGGLS
jgi:hypothetical protein